MRPVRLHAEGFGVFRDAVDVDFDGVDYFALVGPTGAGKSTVIDAICFALYGSVPRYGDERQVARVVSVGKLRNQGVAHLRRSAPSGTERPAWCACATARPARPRRSSSTSIPTGASRHARGQRSRAEAGGRAAARAPVRPLHQVRRAPAGRLRPLPPRRTRQAPRPAHPAARPGDLRHDRATRPPTAPQPPSRQSRSRPAREALAGATDDAKNAAHARLDGLRALHQTLDAARPEDDARAVTIAAADAEAAACDRARGQVGDDCDPGRRDAHRRNGRRGACRGRGRGSRCFGCIRRARRARRRARCVARPCRPRTRARRARRARLARRRHRRDKRVRRRGRRGRRAGRGARRPGRHAPCRHASRARCPPRRARRACIAGASRRR